MLISIDDILVIHNYGISISCTVSIDDYIGACLLFAINMCMGISLIFFVNKIYIFSIFSVQYALS